MTISFSIQDKGYADFERKSYSGGVDFNSNRMDSGVGRQQYLRAVERGAVKLAQESVVVDPDVISCSPIN